MSAHLLDHVFGQTPQGNQAAAAAGAAGAAASAPPIRVSPAPAWDPLGDASAWWGARNRELSETVQAWTDPLRWHRWANEQAARGVWGVEIPREGADPQAARRYLVDSLRALGRVNGWPVGEVEVRAASMLAVPPAPEVGLMLDRIKVYGPPQEWQNADKWYDLLEYVRESASLVSMGERSRLIQRRAEQAGQVYYDNLVDARDRALPILEDLAQGLRYAGIGHALTGPAIGLGLGAGVGLGLVGIGAAVAGVAFWPEISEGLAGVRTWRANRKAKRSSSRSSKGAK